MKKGFTLVELMIVVSILGILAAIVLPQFQSHTTESKESAAQSTLYTVRTQIELYKMQHNGLAPGYVGASGTTPSILGYQLACTSTITGDAVASQTPADPYLYGPYLMKIPKNPFNNLSTFKIINGSVTDFSTMVDDSTGWIYQKETATFKLNTSGTDSDGTAYIDY